MIVVLYRYKFLRAMFFTFFVKGHMITINISATLWVQCLYHNWKQDLFMKILTLENMELAPRTLMLH